jgi:hypothetical protein
MVEPILILVGVGAVGGIVRSIIGYLTLAEAGETYSWKKLVSSILRAAIAGGAVVYMTTDVSTVPTISIYIGAFFSSIGADVLLKELYGAVNGATKI